MLPPLHFLRVTRLDNLVILSHGVSISTHAQERRLILEQNPCLLSTLSDAARDVHIILLVSEECSVQYLLAEIFPVVVSRSCAKSHDFRDLRVPVDN